MKAPNPAREGARAPGNSTSVDPLGDVVPVPFPRLTIVGGKHLAPNWAVFVSGVPAEHHDDGFSFESVFGKKVPNIILKSTDHRRVQNADIAGNPI